MEVWRWYHEKADYCTMCRDLGKDDHCQTCEDRQPELWLENEEAFALWVNVQTQWRYSSFGPGMGGSVPIICGLDYTAVRVVADTMDIEFSPGLLHKIQALEQLELERMRESLADGKE